MKSMVVEDVSDYLAFWTSKLVCHMVPLCNANNILNRMWESLFQNMSKMLFTLFFRIPLWLSYKTALYLSNWMHENVYIHVY